MTGTADTEATELKDIYDLEVLVIPPNKPLARIDHSDIVFIVHEEKTKAIIAEAVKRHKTGQPILIGTASIEYSEQLSELLAKEGVKHQVLNAKQHEREAEIIADAGRLNAVTIATNMAGRGTDIVLGGDPNKHNDWKDQHAEVIKVGGLHVLGTERHESRRIDNQLRGRSGRQGDVGSSQFFLSFDDRLIKRFASEKIRAMLKNLGEPDEPISAPILTRSIENAQKNVESKYYDARRELLKLDDVANHQRHIVYDQRNELIDTEHVSEIIESMVSYTATQLVTQYLPNEDDPSSWDQAGLIEKLSTEYQTQVDLANLTRLTEVTEKTIEALQLSIKSKGELTSDEHFKKIEQRTLLLVLDQAWKEHLAAMDHLKKGINFRSYAQKNPTHEFKKDSYALFEQMLSKIKQQTVRQLCKITIEPAPKPTVMGGGYTINIQPKNNMKLQPADLFTRIFFILLLTFIPPVFTIILMISIIQLIMDMIKQPKVESLMIISQHALGYICQIVKYLGILDLAKHLSPFHPGLITMTLKTIPVSIGLITQNGKTLLGKRSAGEFIDFWEFPGGKIEKDESSHEALVREIREELAISVTQATEVIHIKEKTH